MSLKDRFAEELRHLRESGREFAQDNPQLARFLGELGDDPDVERLLEGFAFLTARLRLKLDDDLPELTHSLLQMLWPNYLRPLPSATIVRFAPVKESMSESQHVPKGSRLFSQPVSGVACEYRTCTDVTLHPLAVAEVTDAHTLDTSVVRLDLDVFSERALNTLGCDQLDFHLSGDDRNAQTLYLWLSKYLHHVNLMVDDEVMHLAPGALAFPGFAPHEALLPYPRNVFDGYRIIQEYFAFPRRFFFFSLTRLRGRWPARSARRVRLEFHFNRSMPTGTHIATTDFSLHCTPAINLFEHSAEPISLNGQTVETLLQPSGSKPDAYEVFSIERVTGASTAPQRSQGDGPRVFHAFESFAHEIEQAHGRTALYYRCRVRDSLHNAGLVHNIAFVRGDETAYIGREETASIDLICTNRDLPLALGVGDISMTTQSTPPLVTYTNICRPTPPHRPVVDASLQWTLISNLSLNYLSLLSAEPLKAVIGAYDFAALHDLQQARATRKRLDGIGEAVTEPMDWLIGGLPIRGLRTRLQLDQQAFLCEGELYLFASVLSHFFSLYASINSFHQLEVTNTTNKEHYSWPLLNGNQPLI